jgi:AP-4 complex subunit beta-1
VSSDEEMLDIMNLLDDRLKHSCAAIVLGTMKVFLNYAKTDGELAN